MKHTHRGNCQICGALQAISVKTDLIAKHGYAVAGWGFFNGVCNGSGELPMQVSRVHTDEVRQSLEACALSDDKLIADYRSGAKHPNAARTYGGTWINKNYVYNTAAWADANEYQRASELERRIYGLESNARQCRRHAKNLKDLADKVHGTEPVKVTRAA